MSRAAAAATLRKLRCEETRLKKLRETLQAEKARARRKAAVDATEEAEATANGSKSRGTSSSSSASSSAISALLPKNRSLESSLALFFTSGRDPRIQLDVTQRLLGSTVLSIAANAGPTTRWDPFDVKPQVFALGKHMALPIFTSLAMLQHFCCKNNLWSVRGPDGAVWCEQGAPPPPDAMGMLPEPKSSSKKAREAAEDSQAAAKHHQRLLKTAEKVEQFEMETVAPLHTWGQPRAPFFFGYFGLLTTVFENATLLPGETDVILNPGSSIELALSHGLTSEHFSRNAADTLVHSAFLRVEKKVRSEFISLLCTGACPEVMSARSATLRRGFGTEDMQLARGGGGGGSARGGRRGRGRRGGGDDDDDRGGVGEFLMDQQRQQGGIAPELLQPDAFDIVVVIETMNYERTARTVQQAKQAGLLMGHASLRVIPMQDAPPHVVEVVETFYVKEDVIRSSDSGLELVGEPVIANAHVSSDNFYSNPDLAYTEAHALAVRKTRKF